jgi:formyltetrahydrofolate-dependent phosphoribosylglycinamide formyltransferase
VTIASRRVAILISGRGSNMEALIRAARHADFPAAICGVISDVEGAPGLARAADAGVETATIAGNAFPDRAAHEAAIEAQLRTWETEIICLAGYMQILSEEFVARWRGRLLNIHPSLLPMLKGLDTHRRALAAGLRIHGCTVHFVTAAIDGGPIIAQAAVPVAPDDDVERLAGRVLAAEHRLYPLALRLVAEGRARMENGATVYAQVGVPIGELLCPDPDSAPVDLETLARLTP